MDFWYRMGCYGTVSFNSTKEVLSCVSNVERYRNVDLDQEYKEDGDEYQRRLKRKAERQAVIQDYTQEFVKSFEEGIRNLNLNNN